MWTANGYKITLPIADRTMFGGRVTLFKEGYGTLTYLALKRIDVENRVSELTAEVARLKKENEEVVARNVALEQKVQEIYPLKEKLRKVENKFGSLKVQYQRVLDFIEGLKLTQKLQKLLRVR